MVYILTLFLDRSRACMFGAAWTSCEYIPRYWMRLLERLRGRPATTQKNDYMFLHIHQFTNIRMYILYIHICTYVCTYIQYRYNDMHVFCGYIYVHTCILYNSDMNSGGHSRLDSALLSVG